jgi:ppGpp synthetase/RelA/SpoT-type nucleotidyltranferase
VKKKVIDDFLKRFEREYDFYSQAARICSEQTEKLLASNGIRAIVTYRAKRLDRLEAKVRERAKEKNYQSPEDIYEDVVDLAGVRIALYFPGDQQEVENLLRQNFKIRKTKRFPSNKKKLKDKIFAGYKAVHFRLNLRKEFLGAIDSRYLGARVEIQVASLFMHAWAEVEHDLIYKPLSGNLSDDELSILDELNGLVLAGEIGLQRLQKAFKQRVEAQDKPFKNEFDLAAFIYDVLKIDFPASHISSNMGRTDLLMKFLKAAKLDRPDRVKQYIGEVVPQHESRPIADQLIDIILARDPAHYSVYNKIREAESRPGPSPGETDASSATALGAFISKWVELEKLLRKVARTAFGRADSKVFFTPRRLVSELKLLPPSQFDQFSQLSHFRNNVVHGVDIPDRLSLEKNTRLVEQVITRLEKKFG